MARPGKAQIINRLAGLVLYIYVLCGCSIQDKRTNSSVEPYRLSAEEKALLQEGDLIMRRGNGMLSSLIVRRLNDTIPVSHCGILVANGDDWAVIHALSLDVSDTDGVQSCSVDEFMDDCQTGTLCIVRCVMPRAHCIAPQARYYQATHKPFDRSFNLQDSTAFFCSELPYRILKDRVGLDLTPVSGNLKFSAFFDTRYFEVIHRGTAYR